MGKLYTDKSIESLSPLEFTRLRPGVYCGSTEYSTQLLIEIVSNAIDEFKAGHGTAINVYYTDENGCCRVEDFAQGFPVNVIREDGETVLQASFDILNTSGKFTEDGVYEGTALGLNGIGSKLTNFLSEWLTVKTVRDGQYELIHFKDGVFQSRRTGESNSHTGTTVEWKPDKQFFNNPGIEISKIKELFKVLTCLCPGLTINFFHNSEDKIEFNSKNGLNDLIDSKVKDHEILNHRLNINYVNGKNKLDFVLTYTDNYSSNIISYVNTGETNAGPHITLIKTIITREVNKFFRKKGWLKEKDENLTGDDIQEGMIIAFNITAPGISYDAQTKTRIVKIDMSPFANEIVNNLSIWLERNEKEIKVIADKALAARKAREAAKKARDAARAQKKEKKQALKFDSKLADCSSKDRSKCEIYITEGDSASGPLKEARNNEYQAVMPVRGKIINCQKATPEQIKKNAEIVTMLEAFFGKNYTINPKTHHIDFDPDQIRYGKIIIMSDADVDGAHIKNLFYTFVWNFCPELVTNGYIYAGVPPLYKITANKGYKYLKNDEALEAYRSTATGKYQVGRMKGLGEMSVDEVEETLMDPDQRIIKQITVNDIMQVNMLFDNLMGTGVTARKLYIKDHSEEAAYNAE